MTLLGLGTPAEERRRRERRVKAWMEGQRALAWLAERASELERELAALRRAPPSENPPVTAPAPITLLLFLVVIGVYFMDRLLARDALAWIVGGLDYGEQLGDLAAAVIPIVFISVEIWLGYHLAQVWREFQDDRAPGQWVALWAVLALLVPLGVVAAVVYTNWGDWGTPFVAAPFVFAGHLVCVMSGTYLDQTLRWIADVVSRWRRSRAIPRAERRLRRTRTDTTATVQRLIVLRQAAEGDGQQLPELALDRRTQRWLADVLGDSALATPGDERLAGLRTAHDEPPLWTRGIGA
ncbi:MAG TPA: hypothetical protein VNM43_02925 [Dehalococcoidia bacterium]|nr:hypothetical protein [Dehalococcoidia bacterium]